MCRYKSQTLGEFGESRTTSKHLHSPFQVPTVAVQCARQRLGPTWRFPSFPFRSGERNCCPSRFESMRIMCLVLPCPGQVLGCIFSWLSAGGGAVGGSGLGTPVGYKACALPAGEQPFPLSLSPSPFGVALAAYWETCQRTSRRWRIPPRWA